MAFLPFGLGNLLGRTAVVIDVLRATTTIITALHNGCPEVLPVELPEE
ncbi:MAG: 2-phosphosulfolactate phosphatase, partial [Firmicutes bacterium]|nr:2-phosphosulfolactate phosphatase [Bacillota bacterium]